MTTNPKPFKKIDSLPTYRKLADKIADHILVGNIGPSKQLPPELEMASQFGVHRSAGRERIRWLGKTGMPWRRSVKRLVVAVPDSER